jgi:hypothetical protein
MEKSIEKLNAMFNELQKSDLISFDEVKSMKNIMGVYMIYSHMNEILYIGHTNKFHVRFGTDLKYASTHTLIKKLVEAKIHVDMTEARQGFSNLYKYKIQMCKTKREAEALEHLAIWILDPKFNNNYIPDVD